MIKLARKKDSESGSPATDAASQKGKGTGEGRNTQGVNSRGNALLSAAVTGLLVFMIPALLAVAYVHLFRAPAHLNALLERVATSYASQQASTISAAVSSLRDRVQAAASSPLARAALAPTMAEPVSLPQAEEENETAAPDSDASVSQNTEQPSTDLETALLAFFPDALSLRLLRLDAMGTAEMNGGRQGLRNHIEVDLVRRVSNGESALPEAYQFEGQWLASLAQMTTDPEYPDRRAVVLITLRADELGKLMEPAGESPGQFTLQQRVYGARVDRDFDIVSIGSGVADHAHTADIPDTNWRVIFSPSQTLIDELRQRVRPSYELMGALLGFALLGFVLGMLRSGKSLRGEIERIIAGAEHRTGMELSVPELVPVARELRRQSHRRARGPGVDGSSVVTHTAGGASNTALAVAEGPASAELPAAIFRAYDIRGHAEEQLDDETVFRIGSAIGTIAGEMGEQTLALAYDGRESSPRIKGIIEKALLQSGRDVIDIGLVPTPVLYFATQQDTVTSGIMITGSHNPAEHNGLKIVLKGRTIAEGTIDKIRGIAQSGRFSKGRGHVIQQDMVSGYLDEIVGDIAIAVPLKIVVDAGNGATARLAPALLEELGCDVIPLHCDVDGSFPNRSPDTSNEANLEGLIAEVLANDADLGVAYDGDGDRLAVVTGQGRILRTDTLMMIFAQDVVSRNPGADVVYDVKCSRNLAQLITGLGGRAVLWKTGHALMKQKMLETGALLGGEFSGHVFFGERWYGFDDGLYATGRLAEILSSQNLSLDELVADLPSAVSTPEILVPVADEEKFALMDRFLAEAQFPEGKRNDLDGLRVDFSDGWGLLRASNTGPALTARFEAGNEEQLEHIRGLFREQLASVAPGLTIPF